MNTTTATMNNIFGVIRKTCENVAKTSTDVTISQEGIDTFINVMKNDSSFWSTINTNIQPFIFGATTHGNKVDVEFVSVDAEINMLATLDILQFASGFRKPLHRYCGFGASDVMTKGTTSIHKEHKNITAKVMLSITFDQVKKHFGFTEEALADASGGISDLAKMIVRELNAAGSALIAHGYADLSALVRDHCSRHSPPFAADLVTALYDIIPAFHDCAEYPKGHEVLLVKKAQLLAGDLYRRFAAEIPNLFAFADIMQLTVFVDNVLPAVLRHYGVIVLSKTLHDSIENQIDLEAKGELEVQLRAVSIHACEMIVAAANKLDPTTPLSKLTTLDLDWYLWVIGKRPGIRQVERHVCRGTCYY